MNISKWFFLSLLLAALSLSGCFIDLDDDDDFFNCVNGNGPIVTQEFFLSNFDGIDLELPARVFIRQGPEQEVIIEGKPNILDEIELDVRNGIWVIETDRCVNDIDVLNIFITMPEIRSLSISGSGSIESDEFLEVDDIDLRISGSGDINLGLIADDIEVDIPGSGDIVLEGTADDLDINISGSGDIRAFGLEADDIFIRISGSGDAELNVISSLTVRISGSGDVEYIGNPSLDIEISGSGDVRDVG
jgi:hypothetical protein